MAENNVETNKLALSKELDELIVLSNLQQRLQKVVQHVETIQAEYDLKAIGWLKQVVADSTDEFLEGYARPNKWSIRNWFDFFNRAILFQFEQSRNFKSSILDHLNNIEAVIKANSLKSSALFRYYDVYQFNSLFTIEDELSIDKWFKEIQEFGLSESTRFSDKQLSTIKHNCSTLKSSQGFLAFSTSYKNHELLNKQPIPYDMYLINIPNHIIVPDWLKDNNDLFKELDFKLFKQLNLCELLDPVEDDH